MTKRIKPLKRTPKQLPPPLDRFIIDMEHLSQQDDSYLVLRLALCYEDLMAVSYFFDLLSHRPPASDAEREQQYIAKLYLEVQQAVHLAGGLETVPEILADRAVNGKLWQRVERYKDKELIENALVDMCAYLEGDKTSGRPRGRRAAAFRRVLIMIRDHIGAHYNADVNGKFLVRSLDRLVQDGKAGNPELLKAHLFLKQNGMPIFGFASHVVTSGWQSQCLGIARKDSELRGKRKLRHARAFIQRFKESFIRFAGLVLHAYLFDVPGLAEVE